MRATLAALSFSGLLFSRAVAAPIPFLQNVGTGADDTEELVFEFISPGSSSLYLELASGSIELVDLVSDKTGKPVSFRYDIYETFSACGQPGFALQHRFLDPWDSSYDNEFHWSEYYNTGYLKDTEGRVWLAEWAFQCSHESPKVSDSVKASFTLKNVLPNASGPDYTFEVNFSQFGHPKILSTSPEVKHTAYDSTQPSIEDDVRLALEGDGDLDNEQKIDMLEQQMQSLELRSDVFRMRYMQIRSRIQQIRSKGPSRFEYNEPVSLESFYPKLGDNERLSKIQERIDFFQSKRQKLIDTIVENGEKMQQLPNDHTNKEFEKLDSQNEYLEEQIIIYKKRCEELSLMKLRFRSQLFEKQEASDRVVKNIIVIFGALSLALGVFCVAGLCALRRALSRRRQQQRMDGSALDRKARRLQRRERRQQRREKRKAFKGSMTGLLAHLGLRYYGEEPLPNATAIQDADVYPKDEKAQMLVDVKSSEEEEEEETRPRSSVEEELAGLRSVADLVSDLVGRRSRRASQTDSLPPYSDYENGRPPSYYDDVE